MSSKSELFEENVRRFLCISTQGLWTLLTGVLCNSSSNVPQNSMMG
jgi:hypothetical protein